MLRLRLRTTDDEDVFLEVMKLRFSFVFQQCEYESPSWLGKCPGEAACVDLAVFV